MRRIRVLALAAVLVAVSAEAAGVGTSGASFLRVRPMARPTAMGNAYTGLAEGIESLSYNPAGLTTVDKWDLGLSQIVYALDMHYSYAAVARRVSPKSVFALHLTYMGADDVQRNATGAIVGQFSNYDLALGLTVAYQVAPEVAVGATGRFIRSELFRYDANAVGADFGVTYRPVGWPGISIGAAVQNIGTGIEYIASSSPQPLSVRMGLAYEPPDANYTLSGDLSVDREAQPRANVGAEYRILDYLALRAGFDVGYDVSFERALKLGVGFLSKVGSFDYTYESMGPTGLNHRFSYSYLGGQSHVQTSADTTGFFAAGAGRMRASRVRIAVPPFANLAPGTEEDWMAEGFREIFLARTSKNSDLVPTSYGNAEYAIEGRYSALGDGAVWVGVKIVEMQSRRVVVFREATIPRDHFIDGATTLAGAVFAALPGR